MSQAHSQALSALLQRLQDVAPYREWDDNGKCKGNAEESAQASAAEEALKTFLKDQPDIVRCTGDIEDLVRTLIHYPLNNHMTYNIAPVLQGHVQSLPEESRRKQAVTLMFSLMTLKGKDGALMIDTKSSAKLTLPQEALALFVAQLFLSTPRPQNQATMLARTHKDSPQGSLAQEALSNRRVFNLGVWLDKAADAAGPAAGAGRTLIDYVIRANRLLQDRESTLNIWNARKSRKTSEAAQDSTSAQPQKPSESLPLATPQCPVVSIKDIFGSSVLGTGTIEDQVTGLTVPVKLHTSNSPHYKVGTVYHFSPRQIIS